LEPAWDEEHTLTGYELGDRLKFQIFDYDKNSQNDLLGRIELQSRMFDHEGGFSGLLRLKACGAKHQALLKVQIAVLPSVETEQRQNGTLAPVPEEGDQLAVANAIQQPAKALEKGKSGEVLVEETVPPSQQIDKLTLLSRDCNSASMKRQLSLVSIDTAWLSFKRVSI
jgi:hypothetical protein